MSFFQHQQGTISIPTISGRKVVSKDSILPSKESAVMVVTSAVCTQEDDDCSVSSNEQELDQYHDSCVELGSFAASASPIDFIDVHGDLPFTNIPSLLPPVVEEEHEEDEEDIIFLRDIPEKKSVKGEEETLATLSTAGSEYTRPMGSPSSITFEHEDNLVQSDQQRGPALNDEGEQMKAMMAMKDVIFEQRTTIKRATKEKGRLHAKYSACKVEKRNLQKENKGVLKEMTKLTRRNEEMEDEIERLRAELDLARMELGRRRPVSDRRRAVVRNV